MKHDQQLALDFVSNHGFSIPLIPHYFYRERILTFAFSLEDMESIPASQQACLLKRNLNCTEMLVRLISFNMNNVQEKMEFMFSPAGCQLKYSFGLCHPRHYHNLYFTLLFFTRLRLRSVRCRCGRGRVEVGPRWGQCGVEVGTRSGRGLC